MKAIVLSLILALSPTVAMSLDVRSQEILEERTCQYLKSGLTLGETIRAIRYAVNQSGTQKTQYELINIAIDESNRLTTKKIIINAIMNRCPEFSPRD